MAIAFESGDAVKAVEVLFLTGVCPGMSCEDSKREERIAAPPSLRFHASCYPTTLIPLPSQR